MRNWINRVSLMVMVILSFGLTGCTKEILAPVVEERIELPPFRYPVENIPVGYTFFQEVNFFAPVGVAPQIVQSVVEHPDRPANIELSSPRVEMITNQVCEPSCSRTAWRLTVVYRPRQAGEATVTIFEATNPQAKISFRVIATVWDGGTKG